MLLLLLLSILRARNTRSCIHSLDLWGKKKKVIHHSEIATTEIHSSAFVVVIS